MNNSTDMTKKILNVSVSVAALGITFCAVWSAVQVKRVADAASAYLTELQQERVELKQRAEKVSTILSECLIYGIAAGLEQEKILSALDAKKMREEALANIRKQSERWGKIAEAISIAVDKETQGRTPGLFPR
jgi:ABC-type transporter MlaC component